MCGVPAERAGKGAGMRRVLVGAAATAVALLSLWMYQPEEEQEETPYWQRGFGGDRDYYTEQAVPDPEVPGVKVASDDSASIGAAGGAVLVLVAQALYLLASKCLARSRGSANTSSASWHEKTLAADLGALLRSGHSADVTFTVGDSQLKAHRAILVARSPVFAAMMAHDCLEATSGHIAINDIEADVMDQLLVFLYTDEARLDDSLMAQKLLVAADKYQVSSLKEQCELVISQNLCRENAAACAVLAMRHSCSRLGQSAAHFIAANLREVMATDGWAEAVRKHPEVVVEISQLVAAASTETR